MIYLEGVLDNGNFITNIKKNESGDLLIEDNLGESIVFHKTDTLMVRVFEKVDFNNANDLIRYGTKKGYFFSSDCEVHATLNYFPELDFKTELEEDDFLIEDFSRISMGTSTFAKIKGKEKEMTFEQFFKLYEKEVSQPSDFDYYDYL